MILSGELYQATELHNKGVIDVMVPPGKGLQEVETFIRDTKKQLRGHKAFLEARRRVSLWPGKPELMQIVNQWVDTVKQLTDRDLKLMDKLVTAQNRLKALAA
jgi:DSF synthase